MVCKYWKKKLISVQRIRKEESKYYEDLLEFGWKNLLLFPYHLSDVIIKGLGITPFHYYINMLDNQMAQEKSYDSLPNFTAADCLRLIGIGRNQYIDLMNGKIHFCVLTWLHMYALNMQFS